MTTPNDRSNKSNSEWASSRGPSVYAVGDGTGNGRSGAIHNRGSLKRVLPRLRPFALHFFAEHDPIPFARIQPGAADEGIHRLRVLDIAQHNHRV